MRLHSFDKGSGSAVLLLHAFPLNNMMWEGQIQALLPRYRVIAPDIRGFGQSPRVQDQWTLDNACDDLCELLDRLQIQKCVVAGLSMGGYIAIQFYKRFASRVRALILADTRARADNDVERNGRLDFIKALETGGNSVLQERMLPRLLASSASGQVRESVRAIIQQTSPITAAQALEAMRIRDDNSELLECIQCPSLVIVGAQDAITTLEESRLMAARIPNARFVEISGVGHLSSVEAPVEFNQALTSFLETSQSG